MPGQNTNAYGAWLEAKRHLDKDKINIVFILTDGDHNDKNVPIQKFYDEIPKWESVSSQQQAYMFIVELTELAIDNKVRDLVTQTKDVQIIHGIEFFILEVSERNPILNIDDDLSFKLELANENWDAKYNNLPISLSLNNPNFTLKNTEYTFKDLPTKIELKPKKPLDVIKKELAQSSEIYVTVKYPAKEYPQIKILNNKIDVQINNRKEKVLKIEVVD